MIALLVTWTQTAEARIRTCLTVEPGREDPTELERLITSEVNRHTSHQVVSSDCESNLRVEVITVGSGANTERFVTARIDAEVPHREPVTSDGLAVAIERALVIVLHNDPRTLSGPERANSLFRPARDLEQRGRNHVGFEIYQVSASMEGELSATLGVGITARREVSWAHVGARLAAAWCGPDCGRRLHLELQYIGQLDVSVYSSRSARTAAFGSGLVGVEYHRYYGERTFDPPGSYGATSEVGPSLGLRGGVEFLRHMDMRVQLFTQIQAPLFLSNDRDHGVLKQWTPTLALGVGVLF